MENLAAKAVAAYMDSVGLHYSIFGDDKELIRAKFIMQNKTSQNVNMIFNEDNTDVHIAAILDAARFDDSKKPEMYKLCSFLNDKYRWANFFVGEEENVIVVQDDGVIQLDSCGEECVRLTFQLLHIIDDATPIIMKTIWG